MQLALRSLALKTLIAVAFVTELPVLLAAAYHPRWRRADGGRVYAASPFLMLTFVRGTTNLAFERAWYERAALWASAGTLLLLLFLCLREGRLLLAPREEGAPENHCST